MPAKFESFEDILSAIREFRESGTGDAQHQVVAEFLKDALADYTADLAVRQEPLDIPTLATFMQSCAEELFESSLVAMQVFGDRITRMNLGGTVEHWWFHGRGYTAEDEKIIEAARRIHGSDDVAIDTPTVFSFSEADDPSGCTGVWVAGWLYVTREELGLPPLEDAEKGGKA